MDPDPFHYFLSSISSSITVVPPSTSSIFALLCAALLLAASGFVSASEIAFFSLSPVDIEKVKQEKKNSDKKIKSLLAESEKLLATILISNNFVNVAIIMLCNFAFLEIFKFRNEVAEFIVMSVILTFLLLLFGEIMPKIYSAQNPLSFARKAAPVISQLERFFYPIVIALVKTSSIVNKNVTKKKFNLSVDELSHALELTDKTEISEENNILKGIIRFGEENAKDVMTPRLDMLALDIKTPYKEVISCIQENVYSRIPVYSDSIDSIKGMLYIKDLLPYLNKPDNFRWQSLVRPPHFVPETKKIDDLLRDFQRDKVHIAIVVDEFGGTSGLVTMEDIIEEIIGEIRDEYDDDEKTYTKTDDNTFIFEGKTLLSDFYKITNAKPEEFEEVSGDSDTLAGLILEITGEIPAVHHHVKVGRYDFEVLQADKRRIQKIKTIIKDNEKE